MEALLEIDEYFICHVHIQEKFKKCIIQSLKQEFTRKKLQLKSKKVPLRHWKQEITVYKIAAK